MTTIFKPGIEKVMKLFYENKSKKLHLREIARKTKLYGQSITRYLNKLEKDSILKSEKDGNLKKYSLKMNIKSYSILALYDIEKYSLLPRIIKSAIELFIDSLDEKPIIVLLFGSTAKQSFTEQSDIDILLIVNKKVNTEKAKHIVDAQTAQKISDFQITIKDFEKEIKLKEDSVVQSAIQTGYPVSNHIYYYRCSYNEAL